MKQRRLLMMVLLLGSFICDRNSLFSQSATLVKLKLYNPCGKADQTTAATQVEEESPGSTEQDAG